MFRKWKINRLRKKIRPDVEKLMIQDYPFAVDEDGNYKPFLSSCHAFWDYEKQLLKEKYNVNWKTPAEEHSDIRYD